MQLFLCQYSLSMNNCSLFEIFIARDLLPLVSLSLLLARLNKSALGLYVFLSLKGCFLSVI